MKEKKLQEKPIILKPIFLTIQDAEEKEKQYISIIEKNYPNFQNCNELEFKKSKLNINDKKTQNELKNVILKMALDEVIYMYLNYNIKGYDFEDAIQDIRLLFEKNFNQFLNIKYLSRIKFYVQNTVRRSVKNKLSQIARKNLDVVYSLDDNLDRNIDNNATINKFNDAEYIQLYEEFRDIVAKYLNNLSPKYQMVLSSYYGLNGKTQLSVSEMTKKYNLTRSMIHRYILNGILKLRKHDREMNLKNYKDGFEF